MQDETTTKPMYEPGGRYMVKTPGGEIIGTLYDVKRSPTPARWIYVLRLDDGRFAALDNPRNLIPQGPMSSDTTAI